MAPAFKSETPHLEGMRSLTVPRFKNYRTFYLPLADGIEVVRVLFAKRDIYSILEREE